MKNPFRMLATILQNTESIMAAQDDMNAAIAGLTTAVTAENAEIDSLVAQLAAEAKAAGTPDATVEGFVSQISALTSSINGKLAQFQPASGGATGATGSAAGGATGAAAATGPTGP